MVKTHLMAGLVLIGCLISGGVAAQDYDGMAFQRCIWSCLAGPGQGDANSAAYGDCVASICLSGDSEGATTGGTGDLAPVIVGPAPQSPASDLAVPPPSSTGPNQTVPQLASPPPVATATLPVPAVNYRRPWRSVRLRPNQRPFIDGRIADVINVSGQRLGYFCSRGGATSALVLSGDNFDRQAGLYRLAVRGAPEVVLDMAVQGPHVVAPLPPSAVLLSRMAAGRFVDVIGPDGRQVASFNLEGSADAITRTVRYCFG